MLKSRFLALLLIFLATNAMGSTGLSEHHGYIVKYKDNVKTFSVCPMVLGSCKRINNANIEVIQTLPPGIEKNENVEYVEPNYVYHALYVPTDDLYPQQWGLHIIQAEKAWDISLGSNDVIVGVIDTGVDYTHPDLKNQMWVNPSPTFGDKYGANFSNAETPLGDPMDDNGHGTWCGGMIGGEHQGTGIVGVNAHVRIMALKFLGADGSGDTAGAIKAVMYGADHGAQILSNSWGGGSESKALKDAISYAKKKGVLFVAAAGNDSDDIDKAPAYPASYKLPNVLSVAASDAQDQLADFSDFGLTVSVAAPGVDLVGAVLKGGFESMSGTSMATPHVAGAAALLLSTGQVKGYAALKKRIITTSDHITALDGKTVNGGRLNLYNMLMNINPVR